ncbi:hypothetical protein EXIGLDRAFT_413637, partial [Exidia glandulosa HHB12029]
RRPTPPRLSESERYAPPDSPDVTQTRAYLEAELYAPRDEDEPPRRNEPSQTQRYEEQRSNRSHSRSIGEERRPMRGRQAAPPDPTAGYRPREGHEYQPRDASLRRFNDEIVALQGQAFAPQQHSAALAGSSPQTQVRSGAGGEDPSVTALRIAMETITREAARAATSEARYSHLRLEHEQLKEKIIAMTQNFEVRLDQVVREQMARSEEMFKQQNDRLRSMEEKLRAAQAETHAAQNALRHAEMQAAQARRGSVTAANAPHGHGNGYRQNSAPAPAPAAQHLDEDSHAHSQYVTHQQQLLRHQAAANSQHRHGTPSTSGSGDVVPRDGISGRSYSAAPGGSQGQGQGQGQTRRPPSPSTSPRAEVEARKQRLAAIQASLSETPRPHPDAPPPQHDSQAPRGTKRVLSQGVHNSSNSSGSATESPAHRSVPVPVPAAAERDSPPHKRARAEAPVVEDAVTVDAERLSVIYQRDPAGNHVCKVCTLNQGTGGGRVGFPPETEPQALAAHARAAHRSAWDAAQT